MCGWQTTEEDFMWFYKGPIQSSLKVAGKFLLIFTEVMLERMGNKENQKHHNCYSAIIFKLILV